MPDIGYRRLVAIVALFISLVSTVLTGEDIPQELKDQFFTLSDEAALSWTAVLAFVQSLRSWLYPAPAKPVV
jgi:hypothetical protein